MSISETIMYPYPYLNLETELSLSGKLLEACQILNTNSIGFCRVISPEIASRILETARNNRKHRNDTVANYKRLIINGEWMIAEPLIFDERGNLIDGQHRLMAVVRSNLNVLFSIFIGIPSDSKAVIDQGKNRTAQDIANIMGMPDTKSIHTNTAGCLTLSHRKPVKMSNLRRNEIYIEYKEGIDFAVSLITTKHTLKGGRFTAAIAKAYYYEMPERLKEFMFIADNIIVTKETDIAAAALGKAYFEAKNKKENRGNEFTWFLKAERCINNFCCYDNDDSVTISDRDFYPLPNIDENTVEHMKRFEYMRKI